MMNRTAEKPSSLQMMKTLIFLFQELLQGLNYRVKWGSKEQLLYRKLNLNLDVITNGTK